METIIRLIRPIRRISLICAICALCGLAHAQPALRINQLASDVAAPQVLAIQATSVTTLFSTNTSISAYRVILRTVQNTGTNIIYYGINVTNLLQGGTNFHGILAPGQAVRDGLGSILDLSRVPFPVAFLATNGPGEVAVCEFTQGR